MANLTRAVLEDVALLAQRLAIEPASEDNLQGIGVVIKSLTSKMGSFRYDRSMSCDFGIFHYGSGYQNIYSSSGD